MKIIRDKKAQSVIEYTVLIITIAAAFIAMSLYLQRAANQRLRQIEQEANPGVLIEDLSVKDAAKSQAEIDAARRAQEEEMEKQIKEDQLRMEREAQGM